MIYHINNITMNQKNLLKIAKKSNKSAKELALLCMHCRWAKDEHKCRSPIECYGDQFKPIEEKPYLNYKNTSLPNF